MCVVWKCWCFCGASKFGLLNGDDVRLCSVCELFELLVFVVDAVDVEL